jgi:hypothetical protein
VVSGDVWLAALSRQHLVLSLLDSPSFFASVCCEVVKNGVHNSGACIHRLQLQADSAARHVVRHNSLSRQRLDLFVFLSQCDFFLWGALKGKVYVNKLRTIQEQETNILCEVAMISEDILHVTFANMQHHVRLCLDSGGRHFQHLLLYGHVSHEERYVLIYECSKRNAWSLRYSHFTETSTEKITLYIRACIFFKRVPL